VKLAASDYDGTLFRRGRVGREDLEAIDAWRERGHLFGLATGRDLNLTRAETEGRRIPFDFLLCNPGAALYDQDYRPLHLMSLPPDAAGRVADHPAVRESRYCLFSRYDRTFVDLHSSESWLTGLGLPLDLIANAEARQLTGLQQISLEFSDPETAFQSVQALNRDLGDSMYAVQSSFCVDIVPGGTDKGAGLALLLELKNWRPDEMLVVGDSENDYSMIRRFNGYAMAHSPDSLIAAARGVVDSPAAMLWAHFK
jgi:HAD superfamily hydrolase (TIGR01484 family)